MTDSIIVSYDNTNGRDLTILLVGKKRFNKPVEVINAFQGKEAEELWTKLTTIREKKNDQTND